MSGGGDLKGILYRAGQVGTKGRDELNLQYGPCGQLSIFQVHCKGPRDNSSWHGAYDIVTRAAEAQNRCLVASYPG